MGGDFLFKVAIYTKRLREFTLEVFQKAAASFDPAKGINVAALLMPIK